MATPLEAVGGGEALEHMRAASAHARRGEKSDAVRAYLAAGSAFLHAETDTTNARRAFEAAAALDPTNLDAAFQVGRTDVIEGRLTDALTKFLHVIERSNQTHVPALFEAGCIYQELGRYDRAILTFRKVLDRDRTNVQAIVNVGRHLQAMGMRPEALGYYVRAAETAFDAGQLGTCRQLLSLVLSIDPLHAKGRTMLLDLNETKAAPKHAKLEAAPKVLPPPALVEPASLVPESLERPAIFRSTSPDALGAPLWGERDALKREIGALAAAKAEMEVELASLRAKHDCAISELDELFKATPQARTAPKPAPAIAAEPAVAPEQAVAAKLKRKASKRPAVKRKAPTVKGSRPKP